MSSPSRRDVLRATVATVVSAIAATGRKARGQVPARPNILWLVSEDNNPYLGCYGDPLARTPNIDALAKRGLLFQHVFSAAPVCAPSRFAILTGIHPESCAPANQMRATAMLPPEIRTYPEYLREAGYYCTNNAKTDFNCDADAAKIFDESNATAHYKNRPAGKPFFAIFNHKTSHESLLAILARRRGRRPQPTRRLPAVSGPCRPICPTRRRCGPTSRRYYNAIDRMDAADRREAQGTGRRRARRRHDHLLLLGQRRRAAAQQALLLQRRPSLRDGRRVSAEVGAPGAGEDGHAGSTRP